MIYAPIALFVYNRLDHLKSTVEALKLNKLSMFSDLIIFSDGSKLGEETAVHEVRNYIHSIDGFKSIKIFEQSTNIGLAESIIKGVSMILENSESVIVIEDDIITSEYFLEYMNTALNLYRNEKKVFHVSGYLPNISLDGDEHVFLKPASCWGWGTWKDRWSNFNNDSEHFLVKLKANKDLIKEFNHNNSYDYFSHLQLNHEGKLKTWAIFWYLTVFFEKGLCLHPKVSYTRNIGHDGTGQNCKEDNRFNVVLASHNDYLYPEKFEINFKAEQKLIDFYNGLKISIIKRIINKFSSLLKASKSNLISK